MEAYRKVMTVKDAILQIMLPKALRNRSVEVIVLPSDALIEEKAEEKPYDLTSLYGKAKSGLTIEQIDEKIKMLRNEWDRLSN